MKKTSLLVTMLVAGMSLTLAGCNSNGGFSDKNLVQVNPYEYETTYRSMRINGSGYAGEQFTEHVNENGQKKYVIENVKALVIPVDFTDYPGSALPLGEEGTKQELEKMMFGDEGDTEWYSLKGYYESSSFGQCKISGKVGDWWHVNNTAQGYMKECTSSTSPGGTVGSQKIAIAIQDYYRKQYSNAKLVDDKEMMAKYDLTQYDANQDGFIDSLILIYAAPIRTTGELFWAFCWSVPGAYGRYKPELEGVNRFFWASYWFFYDNYLNLGRDSKGWTIIPDDLPEKIVSGEAKPDVHTMTHEYGHVLSLPDYYITDYNTSDYDGLGYLDMMDYNIGDHNAMSKSWYGWINPYYVKGSVKATIRSTTKTGDTIIIPVGGQYKNTLMDQYIMIEFLTPDGVAKYDGEHAYAGSYPLYYSQAGIRVTHVDARLGVFNYNTTRQEYQFTGFTVSTNKPSDGYVSTACSNTGSDSCFKNYKLIEILPRQGKSIKYYGASTNEMLFQEGDKFGGDDGIWPNYMMHDKAGTYTEALGFKFEINKINGTESAEITFTKL